MTAPDPDQREPASTPPPDGAVVPEPVRREPPSPRPQGRGGRTPPGAWLLGVFLLCVAGPSMLALSYFPARWALAMEAHQWRWLLFAGGVALGLLGLLAVQAIALDTGGGRAGKIKTIGGGLRSRFLPRCLVLLLAGLAVGGGVASDLAASRLDAYIEAAEPSVGAFYRNHDGARLAGRTVRMVLLRERESTRVEADRAALQRVAGVLPAAWVALATTSPGVPGDNTSRADPGLALLGGPGGVDEPLLSAFLLDRDLGAMDPERWGEVLDRLCDQGGVERLASPVRERASQRLTDIFGLSLRESLKHAWKAGDKAWPALVIDMQTAALERVRSAIDEQSDLWRAEFASLKGSMDGLKGELAEMSEPQRDNHRHVIDRLARLEEKIDRALHYLEEIYGVTSATRAELEQLRQLVVEIMLMREVGGLAPTPEQAEAVERLLALGDPIDKATASIASVRRPYIQDTWSQADEHLATAALWRASGVGWTDDHEARYQMALGDRRRFDDDPDGAVPFYEAALATGPGDPEATIRLALALFEGRAADHGERLRRALELLDGLRARGEALDSAWFAAAMNNLANLLSDLGRDAEALGTIDSVIEIAHRHGGPDHPLFATFYSNRATFLRKLRRLDEAIVAIDRAIEIGQQTKVPEYPTLSYSHSMRANILSDWGRNTEALKAIDRAIEIKGRHVPTDHPTRIASSSNRANILLSLGRFSEALEAIDTAIGIGLEHYAPDHPVLATLHSNNANILLSLGRSGEALEAIDTAIGIGQKSLGPDNPTLATMHSNHGAILGALGRSVEALEAIDRAIEIALAHAGPESPNLANFYANRGGILMSLGAPAGALESIDRVIAIENRHRGPDHPTLTAHHSNRASALSSLGRNDEALGAIDRAIEIGLMHFAPDHPNLATIHAERATILGDLGRGKDALEAIEFAMEIGLKHPGPDHATMTAFLSNRATILRRLGRHDEALKAIDRAIEIDIQRIAPDTSTRAIKHAIRAGVLLDLGLPSEALLAIDRAIEIGFLDFEPDHPNLASLHSNRAAILAKLGETDRAVGALRTAAGIWERHEHTRPMALGAHEDIERILREAGR